MKRLLLFVAFIICHHPSNSQEYKKVDVPNATKDELYKRAVYWLSQNFKSANDVIQLKDKEEGQIIAKGSFVYYAPPFSVGTNYSGYFSFTFTFDCKDGKYRYLIDRVSHEASLRGYSMGAIDETGRHRKKKMYEAVTKDIQDFSKRFEIGMKDGENQEEW